MANPRWRLQAGGYATAIWAAKIAFCFFGVLFACAGAPAAAGALASSLPRLRAALLFWIRLPYLFIAVHFIILVIWKLSDQKQQREQWSAEEFGDPDNLRSSSSIRKHQSQSPSSDLAESYQSVERSTASSMSSIKKSAELESDGGTTVEEEEDLAAALEISGVENDSMEATWKAIMAKPSRTSAPPSAAAASPSSSRPDYRRLDPPPPPVGHDDLTQQFDEFIRKKQQQIRFHTSRRQ